LRYFRTRILPSTATLPPLYAVQRLADGTWLVRTQMGDPILPAVDVVAVVGAPTSAAPRPARAARPLAAAQVRPLTRLRDAPDK
jgi:hypothetical protein